MPNHNEGRIIIASPQVVGLFRQAVVYIHTDDSSGSAGVILNFQMDLEMAERWSDDIGWEFPELIRLGGPIDRHLGYIIHTNEYAQPSTIQLNNYLAYTSGTHIIQDINRGTGPNQFILVTGYALWKPGQLDSEINEGVWVVADFDPELFFQKQTRESHWEYAIHVAAQQQTDRLLDQVDTL